MTSHSRRYLSSHILTTRPRVVSTPEIKINWREGARWLLSLTILVSVVWLTVINSSVSTEASRDIDVLSRKVAQTESKNLQLRAEIAEMERPSVLRERALQMGLVDTGRSIRLAVPPAAAEPQPARASSAAAREERAPAFRAYDGLVQWMSHLKR